MSDSHEENHNNGNYSEEHDEETINVQNERTQQYLQDLLQERVQISKLGKFLNCERLLDAEIQAAKQSNKPFRDNRYVDVYREKPIRIVEKVSIPIKEYPKFNFVGKLLGPSGNSFRRLQEETMCKMAIQGRGSMRDRDREEELRSSCEPKYAHLNEDLHVEISALGPPAEAHARVAHGLAEIRKYLIPDANDTIRQEQFKEILNGEAGPEAAQKLRNKMSSYKKQPHTTEPRKSVPTKAKVLSILDRARVSLEESHRYEDSAYHYPHYPSHSHHNSHHHHSYSTHSRTYHSRNHYAEHPASSSWKSHSHSSHSGPSSYHSSGKRLERHVPYIKPSK